MNVKDLVRRIQDDVEELLARAYPAYTEEWQKTFAPHRWRQFPLTYEIRLLSVIHESIAESLRPGLMKRIWSTTESERKCALAEYRRLTKELIAQEPKHAANALAFLTSQATDYLEHLFRKRPELMREIAKTRNWWPVNLGLKGKVKNGKQMQEVTGLAFARTYLTELDLNSRCIFPKSRAVSPFALAAADLYTHMLLLKDDPSRHVWFTKVTPWAKRLFALPVPMTESSSTDWWNVAKVHLYERWEKAQKEFEPLIKHLGFKYPIELSSKVPYPSLVKNRVIDNDLKDAFSALARPDL